MRRRKFRKPKARKTTGMSAEDVVRLKFYEKIKNEQLFAPSYYLIQEYPVNQCKNFADIVIIHNGQFYGFEIKTHGDSLVKLKKQILAYDRVFHHNSIIVASKHLDAAAGLLLAHWGIIEIDSQGELSILRAPCTHKKQKPAPMLGTLWSNELNAIVLFKKLPKANLKKSRAFKGKLLATVSTVDEVSDFVIKTILVRENWRARYILI